MNRHLRGAVILIVVSFAVMTAIFIMVVVMIRGQDISRLLSGGTINCTAEVAMRKAADSLKSTSTFKFDGLNESLKLVKIEAGEGEGSWTAVYSFQTRHPGHGNRKGQVLAQVITDHTAELILKDCKVVSSACDNEWDLLSDQPLH